MARNRIVKSPAAVRGAPHRQVTARDERDRFCLALFDALWDRYRERVCTRRRQDIPQIDVAPFGLRNHFLRHHDYVLVPGHDPGAVETLNENRGEVVAGLDQRHARQRGIRDGLARYRHVHALGGAPGIPVIRMPAPSIL